MLRRVSGLVFGSALIGLGVVLTVKASWGPASWDIFHLAIVQRTDFSLGQISVATSLLIIAATMLLGGAWSVRWGTLVNTLVVGFSIELFMTFVVPDAPSAVVRGLYVALGTFVFALGTVVYTRAGFGAGARDGLALTLSQRLPLTVGKVRLALEACVALAGWLLGGPIGLGTLVIVFGTGPIADRLYRLMGRGRLPSTVRIPEQK